ncbi:hypothetical protein [Flavivirga eckloniae]|uniref:Uncharacterized protein n=1 Tax=Flavivirga eckloniae TaxID=1803846 RepID=A0A2K9PN94_9FLAO|nr:hypothetical protein [Flavivirga eckloniae]AUP78540.1 hypothetical protein C1H87_07375 [Flavivirga eckloniae]
MDIIYSLEHSENSDIESIIEKNSTILINKIEQRFHNGYEIKYSEPKVPEKDWSHEIKIRKGNKIGVLIGLKWEKDTPYTFGIEITESSITGNMLTYGIIIPISLVGAYMGVNDIEPLTFLPGNRKLAAGLGGLIGLIPGGIMVYVIKSIFMKKEKKESSELIREIIEVISK